MAPRQFYRISIWLPVAVPTTAIVLVHGLHLRLERGSAGLVLAQLALISTYVMPVYVVVAAWAYVRIGRYQESEIRRLALEAPLIVAVVWIVAAAVFGYAVRNFEMFVGLAIFGSIAVVLVGYTYVGIVLALREMLGGWNLISQE